MTSSSRPYRLADDRNTLMLLGIVLLVASCVGGWGIDWGISSLDLLDPPIGIADAGFHPDANTVERGAKSLRESFYPLETQGNKTYLLTVYGTIVPYLHYASTNVASWLLDFEAYGSAVRDQNLTRILGRLISACAYVSSVGVIFVAGWRMRGRRAGLLAAACLGLTPAYVQSAHFATVDTLLAFWAALLLTVLTRPGFRSSAREHIIAGAIVGFAAATKPSGLLLISLPALLMLLPCAVVRVNHR